MLEGSFSLDLTATPSSSGHKTATVQLQMRTADSSQHRTLQANLLAAGREPATLNLLPPVVDFTSIPSMTTFPWRRNLLIANDGQTDLHVTNISLAGSDASSFRLTAPNGSPVPASFVLTPGSSQTLTVHFCPARRGSFHATFQASGNSGDVSHPSPVSGTITVMANAPPTPIPLCH